MNTLNEVHYSFSDLFNVFNVFINIEGLLIKFGEEK